MSLWGLETVPIGIRTIEMTRMMLLLVLVLVRGASDSRATTRTGHCRMCVSSLVTMSTVLFSRRSRMGLSRRRLSLVVGLSVVPVALAVG